jgi:hypothetical protein
MTEKTIDLATRNGILLYIEPARGRAAVEQSRKKMFALSWFLAANAPAQCKVESRCA